MAGRRKNVPKTRDYFMVALIKGATKSTVHVDRKKQSNKMAARKKIRIPKENDK